MFARVNHPTFDDLRKAINYVIYKAMNSGGYTFEVHENKSRNNIFEIKASWSYDSCELITSINNFTIHENDIEQDGFKNSIIKKEVLDSIINDIVSKLDLTNIVQEVIENDNNDINSDNAATFLDKIKKEITDTTHKFMMSKGFPEDEVKDYSRVSTDITDDYVKISVGAELEYDSLFELCQTLDKIIEKHDKDAYFEPECPGRIVAYLFGVKNESFIRIEESNHINIEDKDYATGEEMYNELVKYLNSLDQIAMNGNDCNWEPSEFNAKNLNADGEIYLECGAYILIYPYINEWAEDYFKVLVVDAETCELSIQLKNGIENIFNKLKTDKWKLVLEG